MPALARSGEHQMALARTGTSAEPMGRQRVGVPDRGLPPTPRRRATQQHHVGAVPSTMPSRSCRRAHAAGDGTRGTTQEASARVSRDDRSLVHWNRFLMGEQL
jgi:hypothetical protein